APDLIGMGDSDKLTPSGPDRYTFVEHRQYLDSLLDVVGVHDRVTLVVHDWGSALGFDWAHRHSKSVRGIAYMEAIVRPLRWSSIGDEIRPLFEALRSPAGEEMVLDGNVFVERVLTGAIMRHLDPEEMAEYRRPYVNAGEDRRPTLTWPRQIPFDGEPADVAEIVAGYAAWLATTPVPKLLVVAEPGAILRGEQLTYCRSWPNQTEVTVKGIHFIQEDSPDEIGTAVAGWLKTIP
ncbi:MAG TPA: haloalkane dehalogenase, partial [Acidimicrobiales bacterium]|nr:haloalkane dehalogenase [Acidimicrobiales bacterium]